MSTKDFSAILSVVLAVSSLAFSDTVVLEPVADSYVNYADLNTNYGSATLMYVYNNASYRKESLMRFDLSSIPSNQVIVSATLNLYVYTQAGNTDVAYLIEDDTWGEGTVTWNNRPDTGDQIGSWTLTQSGAFVQGDLTGAAQDAFEDAEDQLLSFYIKGQNANQQTTYRTRNYGITAQRPYLEVVTAPRTYDTNAAVNAALAAAEPGDTVYVADGTYNNWVITIPNDVDGTENAPITLAAETPGGVTFTGNSTRLNVYGSYNVVTGFLFDSIVTGTNDPIIKYDSATHCRFTDNAIVDCSSNLDRKLFVLQNASSYNRIDHNYITGSNSMSMGLGIGPTTPENQWSIYNTFDHNWFYQIPQYSDGAEPLQLATGSGTSPFSVHTLVEWNRFEEALGDAETISVKCSDNIIRYNYFLNISNGGLTLRGGSRNRVEGNFVKSCKYGVRVYGDEHTIINNYMDTPTYGILMYAGEVSGNEEAVDCLVANNTIRNAYTVALGLSVGPGTIASVDNTFVNNILEARAKKPAITDSLTDTDEDCTWDANLLWNQNWPDYIGVVPDSGATIDDPELSLAGDGLYRPGSTSPALGEGTPVEEVTMDMDGQERDETYPDIGCDEDSEDDVTIYPVPPEEVGPTWMEGSPL